ncbi:polysaccharide deacetylase family protein [Actinomadura parmotrematis]|uniref:Polysaccharide deacetylase family protein n=1 Tax=Actinomadura parmotrematis TaxID=2864039 RepID=A0ABS7FYZ0_9ACTN|nr:polysaccharide deacetylase family protein [Actinomadura parmotrematis]MBW8485658.1 polysaccharide deacetylase family protein [Actinomadura parmotrematis]
MLPATLLAGALALAGCASPQVRRTGTVAEVSGVQAVGARAVPELETVTRDVRDPARNVFTAYPEVPGARPLSDALAAAEAAEVGAFERETARPPGPGAGVPELNVRWSLVAAAGDVAGVRLVAARASAAGVRETRRTLWYDGADGRAHASADLLDGPRGVAGLAALVRARAGATAGPSRIGAGPAAFPSLAFTASGALAVELADPAPGERQAPVLLEPASYRPLLSAFGRRARDAALTPHPRLTLAPLPPAAPQTAVTRPAAPAARTDCARARCVALTFDDGPGPRTAGVLDALRDAGARATFFVVGDSAAVHQDLLRRIAAGGHEIGNLTGSHRDLSRLTAVQVNGEVQPTQDIVRTVVGRAPVLLRPPYAATNPTVAGVARSLGVREVLWTLDSGDLADDDAASVAARVARGVRPGSVVLLHDTRASAAGALPSLLQALRAAGYTFVTVSELGDPPPSG